LFPSLDVPATGIVLASACTDGGGRRVLALSRSAIATPVKPESKKDEKAAKDREKDKSKGKQNDKAETTHLLWDLQLSPTNVWPQLTSSFEGRRIARATLNINRPIGISSPLDREDIRGQTVQVYDLATGKSPLTVPTTRPSTQEETSPSPLRQAIRRAQRRRHPGIRPASST